MKSRRLQALQNLANRPGTEAEGAVAREMLERHQAKEDPYTLAQRIAHAAYAKVQTDIKSRDAIAKEIRLRFPKGTRVYYNKWAYRSNSPGVVTGYPRIQFDGSWGWIRIKFDHLKYASAVPIYSSLGWHLSGTPVSGAESLRLQGLRVSMDEFL